MIFNRYEFGELNEFQESYKERNLYYKIFAGYLFNELISNNQMGKAFLEMLKILTKEKELCIEKKKWEENIELIKGTNKEERNTVVAYLEQALK